MDNKQSLEDKPATNAAAEEILSEEELDSVAGGGGTGTGSDSVAGGGTGCGSYSVAVGDSGSVTFLPVGGTGRGDRVTINTGFYTVDPSKNTNHYHNYAGSGPG